MILRRVLAAALVLGGLLAGTGAAIAADASRTFSAPPDRVFTVTRSVLKSLGRGIDKEDRVVGWLVTDSRRLDGDNFGVYAKGVKHRLRVSAKRLDGGRSAVSGERRVYREERILFEIGRSL